MVLVLTRARTKLAARGNNLAIKTHVHPRVSIHYGTTNYVDVIYGVCIDSEFSCGILNFRRVASTQHTCFLALERKSRGAMNGVLPFSVSALRAPFE